MTVTNELCDACGHTQELHPDKSIADCVYLCRGAKYTIKDLGEDPEIRFANDCSCHRFISIKTIREAALKEAIKIIDKLREDVLSRADYIGPRLAEDIAFAYDYAGREIAVLIDKTTKKD